MDQVKGVKYAVSGKGNAQVLTITIPLNQDHGVSSTGKSRVVATTGGAVEVPGHAELFLSVNLNKRIPKAERVKPKGNVAVA